MSWIMRRVLLPALAIAATVTLAAPSADAQRRWGDFRENQWEVMEERQVRPGTSSVVLPAAGRRGATYTGIRIRVLDEPIYVDSLRIVYGNGTEDDRPIRRVMRPGETTEPIDLEGGARYIQAVRVVFRQDADWRRTARVVLLGDREEARQQIRPQGPRIPIVRDDLPEGWVRFGTQRADFGGERDVIVVGRERGVFDKIALRVRQNEIFLRNLRVVFGNGEAQDFPVNDVIRPEYRTEILRLERSGFIDRIELFYASRPTGRVEAVVDVYGEYAVGSNRGSGDGFRATEGWALIGAKKASMLRNDNDEFPVGERAGRLTAIRLLARKSDVEVRSITLFYASGDTETINVNRLLRRDQASPDLILRGRAGVAGRAIRGISINHRSVLSLRGEAVIEVWGRR